jgi:hypothetical protein
MKLAAYPILNLSKEFFLVNVICPQRLSYSGSKSSLECQRCQWHIIDFSLNAPKKRLVRSSNASSKALRALRWNSNARPSSTNLYVLGYPLEQPLSEIYIFAAVPPTKCSSPPRAKNGTTASEKAASLSSRLMTLSVLASRGQSSMSQIHDPHVPAAAFGRPNSSTMSDQVFVMSQVFVILDFLSSLKTPILHILPDHPYILLKYEY